MIEVGPAMRRPMNAIMANVVISLAMGAHILDMIFLQTPEGATDGQHQG